MLSQQLIQLEEEHGAHNYHPLPVVIARGEGIYVYDVEGKRYFDFLSGYSAVSQGHCHPRILKTFVEQASRCTLTARAFHNDQLPRFTEYITRLFGYDMVLPMNTGAEAVETAVKLAKKWGYLKKGIPEYEGLLVSCEGCFHGRTMTAVSMSTDSSCQGGFGPFLPGIVKIPYNNANALEKVFQDRGNKIYGFIVEPIQGEAGVLIPDDGYLKACQDLCRQHNILFIVDEIQTAIGRCGKLLCSEWEGVRGDILILAKALSGGFIPISCVLADKDIMLCIKPGEHGSTYGGNPLASATAITALKVIVEEGMVENSRRMGDLFREECRKIACKYIKDIRGRGLFNAIEITKECPVSAWDICIRLRDRGLLTKPTHETSIRLAPPLTINEKELREAIEIIRDVFESI